MPRGEQAWDSQPEPGKVSLDTPTPSICVLGWQLEPWCRSRSLQHVPEGGAAVAPGVPLNTFTVTITSDFHGGEVQLES